MHAHATRFGALFVALGLAVPALAFGVAHPGRPARATPLNDSNIIAIVAAANAGDIANGKLVLGMTTDAGVKQFAQRMVTDHGAADLKLRAMARREGLHAVPNATSRGLVRSANAKHDELAQLHGAAFDQAYMDAEVTAHQAVLDLLDLKLIPAAQNEALKQWLENVRPIIAGHLEMAKTTEASVKG